MMTLRAPTFWKAEDQMQQRRVRWQGGHRCSSASPGVFHGRVSSLPSQSSPGRLPGSSAWPLGTWGDAGAPVQVGSRGCLPAPACGPCRSTALSPPHPPWGRRSICRGRAGGGVSQLPPSCHHIYAIGTLAGCDWPLFGMHLHPRGSSTPAKALLKLCASRAVKSWSFRQPKH